MNILNYRTYNAIKGLKPAWLEYNSRVDEGIQFINGDSESKKILIDFNQDLPGDVVKLKDPNVPNARRFMYKFPVYAGYKLEEYSDYSKFIEYVKDSDAISDTELKALINHTFPKKLREYNMAVLFVTGSSSPLTIRIAEALRDLYYRKARIVDVLKAYYGVDIRDIVNWEKYQKASPVSKEIIDDFLKSGSKDFDGYIKKSRGLRSGVRDILNPGHIIDAGITSEIESVYDDWYNKPKDAGWQIIRREEPHFLFIDEFAQGGTTLSGIFKKLDEIRWAPRAGAGVKDFLRLNMHGYVLFSRGDEWKSN